MQRDLVRCALAIAAVVGWPSFAAAQSGPFDAGPDLEDLSLEELAQVEITSVSMRAEPVGEAAASVFVITAEDIRRSGAPSLPDVLRLAPNLQVQRMNAGEYAVSARGFNGFETANKLLVLVDGRSIYSPLHSGVFWDTRSPMLQDLERIEVVSGTGGATYGANAVNGVISIVSRSAFDTQGMLGSISLGTEDSAFALRYGGGGQALAWRAYANGFRRDDSLHPSAGDATDAIQGARAGFRTDWTTGQGLLTVQGEVFSHASAEDDDYSGARVDLSGGHLLGRWSQDWAGGNLSLQAYHDRTERSGPGFRETVQTSDLQVQFGRDLGGRHHLIVGGGYRSVASELASAPGAPAFLWPEARSLSLTNLFIQDQVSLGGGLTLTLGAKFEDNSFSGREFLPNARLSWRRPGGDLLWAAVSRAARTPNRIERDLTLPGLLVGGDFQSETLTAYEIGYRAVPRPNLSLSISAFYNRYDDLRTVELHPSTVLPISFGNGGRGETYGLEAWTTFQPAANWRLGLGVSLLHKNLGVSPESLDITGLISQGDDPDYQVLLRSQTDLTDRLELDASIRAVGALIDVDAYVDADVRLGWEVSDTVEVSLSGRDLFSDRRVETGDPNRRRAFGRSVFATVTARF